MGLALTNKTIDKYFGFLIEMDDFSKKLLIRKLTESIDIKKGKNIDLSSLYGSWDDERDSDEIIKDIKNSRVEKQIPIDFE